MSGRVGGGGGNGRTDFRSSPESSKTGYRFRLNGAADWVFFCGGGPVDGLQRLAESRPLTPRVLFLPVFFFFFFFFFFFSSCRSWKLRRWRKSRKYLPPPPQKKNHGLPVGAKASTLFYFYVGWFSFVFYCSYRLGSVGFRWSYWVLPDVSGFYWYILDLTGFFIRC